MLKSSSSQLSKCSDCGAHVLLLPIIIILVFTGMAELLDEQGKNLEGREPKLVLFRVELYDTLTYGIWNWSNLPVLLCLSVLVSPQPR